MKHGRVFTSLSVVAVVLVLLLAATGSASALEQRTGQTVVIEAGEVINDDLLVSAQTFVLNGTVKGDIIAVGQTMTIGPTGVVEGDLMAAGSEVVIEGTVMDDARIAGAALTLGSGAQVGDDLMGAGYSLETAPDSTVGGSLFFFGAQALLAGSVKEDARAGVGGLSLQGQVGGDVEATVGSPQETPAFSPFNFIPDMPRVPTIPYGLTIGPGASIGGSLDYTAPQEASIPPGVVKGQVNYTQTAPRPESRPALQPSVPPTRALRFPSAGLLALAWLLGLVRNMATLLIVGLLLAWLAPGLARRGSELVRTKPGPALGWGVVAFFGVWIAAAVIVFVAGAIGLLLAVFTLFKLAALVFSVGLLLAAMLVVAYVIAAGLLAKIIVGYLIGRLILPRLDPATGAGRVWPLVLGLVILAIVFSIPCLGWLGNLIVVLFGLGAIWLLVSESMRRPTSETAVEQTS
jgi:cytoskeletal protein CcmA (bactofilin family)